MSADSQNSIIGDGDIEKVKKYKEALDNLQSSINGLNSKLPSFADGMKAGLQGIGEKLPEVIESIKKLNEQNKELAASGQKPKSILKELAGSLFSLNSLVSVGITLLASYSGVIIDWISNMIKGQTTLTALGKAMKDHKLVLDGVNKSRDEGDKNAQQELVHLKLLYDATQNHNLSLNDRKKVIGELRNQYPNYFKGLSDEAILTGKAASKYQELTTSIIAASRARAAEGMIVDNSKKQLANSIKAAPLDRQSEKLKQDIKAAEANYNSLPEPGIVIGAPMYAAGTGTSKKQEALIKLNELKKSQEIISKQYEDIKADSRILNQQNELLTKKIIEDTKKLGTDILTGTKTSEGNTKNNGTYRPNKPKQYNTNTPKPDTFSSEALVAAQSITIAQHFENEKKAYDNELALLNDQLSKKLISQTDYNKQSQALQEQYHQGIGSSVEKFALEDMAKTQKHLKDVAEAEGKFAYDETNVKKAILPGQKLDAEKQLITDKYNYEIVLANGNAEKIKELEVKKQEALTSVTQQYEQQRKEFALNTAQQVADKAFSIIGNNIKASSDAKIKGLEKDKAGELSNKNLTETQRKVIEDKYQKKENQEKVKAFKAEQRMSVLQAVVNGALAITKVTAQSGIFAPFVIPGIIASTALQIATIVAQKPPAFAKGGRFVSDGLGALLPGYSRTDNTNAFLRSGEAVVVSEAMRNPWARNLVSAINVAHGGRDFNEKLKACCFSAYSLI
ncbi:MAG: hypothetical protein V4456_02885 [Bacteroidota bacterium]